MNDARLRWQCRRGVRELDVLLEGYLSNAFGTAGDEQKVAFRRLLTLPDPELIGYLLGGLTPQDSAVAEIVSQIRDRPHA